MTKSLLIVKIWERKIAEGLTESSSAIFVVVPLGLEPRTPWLWVRCSNQLSYRTCLPEAFAKIILKFVICKCSRCIFSWLRHSNTHVEYNSKCKIIESVWRSNFFGESKLGFSLWWALSFFCVESNSMNAKLYWHAAVTCFREGLPAEACALWRWWEWFSNQLLLRWELFTFFPCRRIMKMMWIISLAAGLCCCLRFVEGLSTSLFSW